LHMSKGKKSRNYKKKSRIDLKNATAKVTLINVTFLFGRNLSRKKGVFAMPDIKQLLNEEIRRLARKEIKSSLQTLCKQLSEQKRVITELKKQVASLEKRIPVCEKVTANTEDFAENSKKLRLNAKGIVKIRTKLGLPQEKFAALLGVSGHTVSLWEIGKVSPRANTKAAICALRRIGKKDLKKKLLALDESIAEK